MTWKNIFHQKPKSETASAAADLKVVVLTDLGNLRSNNEDTGLFFRVADKKLTVEKGSLMLVADGMGGHQGGEVASRMAGEIVSREYYRYHGTIEKSLTRAFLMANKQILGSASADPQLKGMGTTCTALVVVGNDIYFAHVGDSRAYILHNKVVTQITTDHTYVQELVKAGEISAAAAEEHPQRNILTNAMGTKPQIRVDAGKYALTLQPQDRLMICSDGLYDYLGDADIAGFLQLPDLHEAAAQMIAVAKNRGGHDNITVVVAERWDGAPAPTHQTKELILPVTKEIDLP